MATLMYCLMGILAEQPKEQGVSIPKVLSLSFIHESPNYQSTQGEIRNFLNSNSSTVSVNINRLEKLRLLARLPKSGDKRVVNIALTSAGDKLLSTFPSLLFEQLSEKLQKLDKIELRKVEASSLIVLDNSLENNS